MKKILVCFLILSCLVGCSNKETTVCKSTEGGLTVTNTIVSSENIVSKQTLVNEFDYGKVGYTLEDIENLTDLYARAYDYEGIEYSFEVKDGLLIEKIVIDFDSVNLNNLVELGLIENLGNMTHISLDKTIKSLEDVGFKCE